MFLVIYNSYILPNNVTSDSYFLRYEFVEALLDALGIKDESGVIYELIQYRYFEDQMLGDWELMIDSMVNVRNSFAFIININWINCSGTFTHDVVHWKSFITITILMFDEEDTTESQL